MAWLLALFLGLVAPFLFTATASAERYSYKTCINATKLWCRHQRSQFFGPADQPTCVGMNARQCADCATLRYLRPDDWDVCREWLDGTFIRAIRHPRLHSPQEEQ